MVAALMVFFNSCQSMKRLFQVNNRPATAVEILDMALPYVGEFPEPEEISISDFQKAKPVRVLSPTFLQNMAYYILHALLPTKSGKCWLEGDIQARSEVL
jgi:hypothetical protein